MFARCPACQTVFRVRPEQLRAHAGQVRCGHCLNAFDALDNLLDDASPGKAPAQPEASAQPAPPTPVPAAPVSPQAMAFGAERSPTAQQHSPVDLDLTDFAPAVPKEPGEHFFVLEERAAAPVQQNVPPAHDDLDFDIPETLVPFRRRGAPPPPRPSEAATRAPTVQEETFFESIEFLEPPPPGSATATERPTAVESESPAETPIAIPPWADEPAGRLEPHLPRATEDAPAHTPPQPEPAPAATAPAEAASTVRDDQKPDPDTGARTAPSGIEDNDYAPPARATAGRSLLGIGVGLLAGVLAVQSTYIFRNEIARDWPALRPMLLTACEQLNCTINLPRVASEVSVDASDLQSEPSRPGRYTLNASIRNRAPYAQAYPHLELTLTDARDQPLTRRVLAPEDWAPGADFEHGMPAGREVTINLPFEASGPAAAGYRIYVFYP